MRAGRATAQKRQCRCHRQGPRCWVPTGSWRTTISNGGGDVPRTTRALAILQQLPGQPLGRAVGFAPMLATIDPCTSRNMACGGFVGERIVQLATEYHSSDFDFDEHAAAVAPHLERQAAEAVALNAGQWSSSHAASRASSHAACTARDGEQWEVFYRAHPRARFFKVRRA
jgi:hypothetical protein